MQTAKWAGLGLHRVTSYCSFKYWRASVGGSVVAWSMVNCCDSRQSPGSAALKGKLWLVLIQHVVSIEKGTHSTSYQALKHSSHFFNTSIKLYLHSLWCQIGVLLFLHLELEYCPTHEKLTINTRITELDLLINLKKKCLPSIPSTMWKYKAVCHGLPSNLKHNGSRHWLKACGNITASQNAGTWLLLYFWCRELLDFYQFDWKWDSDGGITTQLHGSTNNWSDQKIKTGLRGGFAAESTHCSYRKPGFSSQHLCWVTHNSL